MNLNIGGGKFSYPGWLNLDATAGFELSPTCVFSPYSNFAEIVYSSHCLEHLDDATVDRVLSEARRCLTLGGGKLVLKLPDFEEVIKRRAEGDISYFRHWGQNSIVGMWDKDTIDARAAMIFCGYWNDAYGDEFKGPRRPKAPGAYHGPPRCEHWEHFAGDPTPHEITESLRACVPEGAHFNHQNAWSRAELKALLERHGFKVKSMDAAEVCKIPIPTIDHMRGISMYVHAT